MLVYAPYSLEELFFLVQKDDDLAFAEIYQRTWQKLFVAANSRLRNEMMAKEIVQEIFVDLWSKRNLKRIEAVESYLFQSVKYKVIDYFRRKPKQFEVVEDFLDTLCNFEPADGRLVEQEYNVLVEKWIASLPKKRRQIFTLRFVEDKTTQQISHTLNISTKTVQNQLLNATMLLKQMLRKIMYLLFMFVFHQEIF
ncbi:RNA polymerase sigma factor [Sphingobacterium deserti]|uniref:RNA polymerase, sigma-24 subunit, ECF subfamily n=1 Tax=Sphingobacterium deserti TaxID=1229276 RepID=A0A0B8T3R7_9SPHI|nr:sigma-70 family RNA polymerase sigma factor [Sphingobacterium deserti]KGE15866.1 RNA polymerase, sigma-24 subunit, ECF subfamily [Sphingobacterium deserti]